MMQSNALGTPYDRKQEANDLPRTMPQRLSEIGSANIPRDSSPIPPPPHIGQSDMPRQGESCSYSSFTGVGSNAADSAVQAGSAHAPDFSIGGASPRQQQPKQQHEMQEYQRTSADDGPALPFATFTRDLDLPLIRPAQLASPSRASLGSGEQLRDIFSPLRSVRELDQKGGQQADYVDCATVQQGRDNLMPYEQEQQQQRSRREQEYHESDERSRKQQPLPAQRWQQERDHSGYARGPQLGSAPLESDHLQHQQKEQKYVGGSPLCVEDGRISLLQSEMLPQHRHESDLSTHGGTSSSGYPKQVITSPKLASTASSEAVIPPRMPDTGTPDISPQQFISSEPRWQFVQRASCTSAPATGSTSAASSHPDPAVTSQAASSSHQSRRRRMRHRVKLPVPTWNALLDRVRGETSKRFKVKELLAALAEEDDVQLSTDVTTAAQREIDAKKTQSRKEVPDSLESLRTRVRYNPLLSPSEVTQFRQANGSFENMHWSAIVRGIAYGILLVESCHTSAQASSALNANTRLFGMLFSSDQYLQDLQARPAPPSELIPLVRRFFSTGGQRQIDHVVDIGIGSSKSVFAWWGHTPLVTAVDPCAAARDHLVHNTQQRTRRLRMERQQIPTEIRTVDGHGQAIPLPDASVSVVSMCESIALMELHQTMREVHRVLQPGGCCCIVEYEWPPSVPPRPALRDHLASLLHAAKTAPSDPGWGTLRPLRISTWPVVPSELIPRIRNMELFSLVEEVSAVHWEEGTAARMAALLRSHTDVSFSTHVVAEEALAVHFGGPDVSLPWRWNCRCVVACKSQS